MSIRQTLNQNRALGLGIAAVVLLAAGVLVYRQLAATSEPAAPTRAFYTEDNGKTSFVDDINKLSPFDHNGKPAYRAAVFQCAQGHRFVGLIYRHNDAGRKEMQSYIAENRARKDRSGAIRRGIEQFGMQV